MAETLKYSPSSIGADDLLGTGDIEIEVGLPEHTIYIKVGSTMLALHATTDINVVYPSSVTSFPVESGATITDNVVRGANSITFAGVLTNMYDQDVVGNKSPQDYIASVKAAIDAKKTFDVYFSKNVAPLRGCVAVDFSIKMSSQTGSNGFVVNISFTQVRFKGASQVSAQPAANFAGLAAKLSSANAATKAAKKDTSATSSVGSCVSRHKEEERHNISISVPEEYLLNMTSAKCTPNQGEYWIRDNKQSKATEKSKDNKK